MHLILTGATGLVGAGVLQNMLTMEGISRISILSRRPVAMVEGLEDKAKVIIHKDFLKYDQEVLDQLKDAQGVVWALGVSQSDVSKEKYYEITHEYTMAAAEAFSTLHPDKPFNFVYVSGEGATQNPGMFSATFAKVKGQAEQSLLDFGKTKSNFNIFNVRPAGVDWTSHPEIHPFIPSLSIFRRALLFPIEKAWKNFHSPTRQMGRVMTELAMSNGAPLEGNDLQMGGRLIPNIALRRLGGW